MVPTWQLRNHTGLLLTTWLAAQGWKPAKGMIKALKPAANEDSDKDGVSSQRVPFPGQ